MIKEKRKNITKSTQFKTETGRIVVVTAELRLTKTHYADGWDVDVDCCEMGVIVATIDGFPDQMGYLGFATPKTVNGIECVARIGQLALSAKNNDKVQKLIADLKTHPEWMRREENRKKNEKEAEELYAKRLKNGYCYKCGSYCYGDCGR